MDKCRGVVGEDMSHTKRTATKSRGTGSLRARWTALLERVRSRVPAEVTDEELDSDIREAIEEVRREERERAGRS